MKKKLLLLIMSVLFSLFMQAQTERCFTSEFYQEALKKDPSIAKNREDLELFTQQYAREKKLNRFVDSLPYIIPVVFHVLHNYGPENVSDIILIEAIRLMNLDYRKLNADTINIVPSFKQIAADCQIEFRLATIDPNGNCTNGIDRIATLKTYQANEDSKLNPWPNNKYLNIWVANSLELAGAAAYATFPGTVSNLKDGIMCWYTYANNTLRALTHEAGHCFNLSHPWGSGSVEVACGDDGVDDTPETKGWQPGHCDLNGSICNPPIIENVQNYMDYSYCDNMFTDGQKIRMRATLNSSLSGRNNLWTDSNRIATGTTGIGTSVCVPIADFSSINRAACAGDSVLYSDKSWNAVVTNWNWSFPGGSPSTSNLKNPKVAYSVAGIYDASLKVSNASGEDSITRPSLIRITASPLNSIPYVESFEDSASFPGNDGWIEDPSGGSRWARITNAAYSGVASIKMNNFINSAGTIDSWITPSFDFSTVNSPIVISFRIANAQRTSSTNDELAIFYSLNCSNTWVSTSYARAGPSLSTVGVVSSNFTPNNPSQWRRDTFLVNVVKLKPNIRFKFQNTCDHGNNIYIDDINITGSTVGVNDVDEVQTEFELYPNPSAGVTDVSFSLSKSCHVKLEIKDILGKTVSTVLNENISGGIHNRKLPVLTSGIYIVDLIINNKHFVRKLIIS